MLSELIQRTINETQEIKQKISTSIRDARPDVSGPSCFTVQFKQVVENDGILSAAYYNTRHQLDSLADYASRAVSLSAIYQTMLSVIETGRALPFKQSVFNKETREILRSLFQEGETQ